MNALDGQIALVTGSTRGKSWLPKGPRRCLDVG
jgi:hypothetical protein